MRTILPLGLILFLTGWLGFAKEDVSKLFCDLEKVHQIDERQKDALPFFYNQDLLGGYFLMPSARMAPSGMVALGGSATYPYNMYGGNVQLFNRLELSGSYRAFKGGIKAFLSDDTDRIVNAKFALLKSHDCLSFLPTISVGFEDFLGSHRCGSQYVVATKSFIDANFELTVGWGRQQIEGLFGGAAWSPLRKTCLPVLKDITLQAEYDATDDRKNVSKRGKDRKRSSRLNWGASYLFGETLQISAFSLRGNSIGGSASIRYPLGESCGLFPKTKNSCLCEGSPLHDQSEECLVDDLVESFKQQGLPISQLSIFYETDGHKSLWIKIVNPTYRLQVQVRERLEHLLAALVPRETARVFVVIAADGIPATAYCYNVKAFYKYKNGEISSYELSLCSPLQEATSLSLEECNSYCLYERGLSRPTFLLRPRALTFFGAKDGDFKYNVGLLAAMHGYFLSEIFYHFQVGYQIKASDPSSLNSKKNFKPPSLPEVRTDTLHYYETSKFTIEEAYLQKGWNLTHGWYARLSGGYFEPAFGGGNIEFLYYPVTSWIGIGAEGALVAKRRYTGMKFTRHTRQLKNGEVKKVYFLGKQAFLNFYTTLCPLDVDLAFSVGRFLGEDIGVRTEMTHQFKSGFRFSVWYTLSRDQRHFDHLFHDRGFSFSLPLDFFMKKSSRSRVGYALASQLRNNGARTSTGKYLYQTLREERR